HQIPIAPAAPPPSNPARFPPLEVFRRRPSRPASPSVIGPASENLHMSRPQANETAANLPEPNDRTRLSYTLALSKWAAMGNASSVLLVYFPKVFWTSLIRAPRDESLACDTGPANGDPAT